MNRRMSYGLHLLHGNPVFFYVLFPRAVANTYAVAGRSTELKSFYFQGNLTNLIETLKPITWVSNPDNRNLTFAFFRFDAWVSFGDSL